MGKKFSIVFLSVILLLGSITPFTINFIPDAFAQTEPFNPVPFIIENPRTSDPLTSSAYDEFGHDVSTNGQEIVVGAPSLRFSVGFGPGTAFLFDENGLLINELIRPSPSSADLFGGSVSIDDSNVLIGSHGAASGKSFEFNDVGTYSTTYSNTSPGSFNFGIEVSILGNYALSGVPQGNGDSGIAHLTDRTTGATIVIANPTPGGGDVFGASNALGPNFVVVASQSHDEPGAAHAGEVYLFDYSGNQLVKISNPTPTLYDAFGVEVAVDGNDVLISASGGDSRGTQVGTVYLYDETGSLQTTFNNPDPNLIDRFGSLVDLFGDLVVIAASQDDTGADNAGSVYVFDKAGTLLQTINNPSPGSGDLFGNSISFSDNLLVVGAPRNDGSATNSGEVYLYSLVTSSPDSDNDGVSDAIDACPATTAGAIVDATGCELLTDPVIPDSANVANGVELGDGTVLGEDVTVSKDTVIGESVTVGDNAEIAKDVTVGSGAVIGNNVTIEKDVTISPGAVVSDGTHIKKNTVFP